MIRQSMKTGSFQKGMTLEQYLRKAEFPQNSTPTADTKQSEEENLYKTSHQFYNSHAKYKISSMREIEEENYEDLQLLESQCRQHCHMSSSINKIINKKPISRQGNFHNKNFRIRNGKSVSPYQNKHEAQISGLKTQAKQFYNPNKKKDHRHNFQEQVYEMYNQQHSMRKSSKNIGADGDTRGKNFSPANADVLKMDRIYPVHDRAQAKKKWGHLKGN